MFKGKDIKDLLNKDSSIEQAVEGEKKEKKAPVKAPQDNTMETTESK